MVFRFEYCLVGYRSKLRAGEVLKKDFTTEEAQKIGEEKTGKVALA